MELSGISIIIIICYVLGEIIKQVFKGKYNAYIPLVLTIIGGMLGILIYITNKEIMMNCENVWTSIVIGLISGSASTGSNQIIKQLMKEGNKNE